MCGICGIVEWGEGLGPTEDELLRMSAVLRHRGPDDTGSYLSHDGEMTRGLRAGLGHTRLSIIDVEGGHQPLSNEDGTIWIVYNGEIYNFKQIRDKLLKAGHTFRTRCDTEVIVHLYEEKDVDCLQELRGMFAFAIWDDRKGRLFLARDRLGQKPLSYLAQRNRFVFASETKAILQLDGVPREVDMEALHYYMTYHYVPHPWSMFRGFKKLPPASYLVMENGRIDVRSYWEPRVRIARDVDEREYRDRLRSLLWEATDLRMMSDVPLGAFLSGGVDSSIVVGMMSKLAGQPVRTFSIGFKEKKYDELDYATTVAKHFRTEHKAFVVRPRALEVLPTLIWQYDEPFADSSAIPTYYVSKMTSEYVKVALTGDAGDECFAGYPRYRAVRLGQLFDKLPRIVRRMADEQVWKRLPASFEARTLSRRARRFLQAICLSPEARYLRWCCIFDDERKRHLYSDALMPMLADLPSLKIFGDEYERAGGGDFLAKTMFVDLMRYLPDDLLVKVDIASMTNSLETRSPFLDHHVVEFALTVPTRLKLKGLRSKHLLKEAFADMLPPSILKRKKMGFGVPISAWFRRELRDFMQSVLLDGRSLSRGYFEPAAVRKLIRDHLSGRFDHSYRLWALLVLELWHRQYIDSASPSPPTF